MPRKILEQAEASTAEARKILERADEEELGEFQKRVLEYAQKFSKLKAERARKLVEELTSDFGIDRKGAVQVVNCMPKSVGELRAALSSRVRTLTTEELEGMLKVIDKAREKE